MTQILRQSTEVIVRVGPAVAVGDGFTPVTTLALSTADEAEALRAAGAATLDISGATFAAITGADGHYDLTLSTTATNTVGTLDIVINDDSLILPIFKSFQVVEEAVYDAIYAASAPGPLAANSNGSGLTEAGGDGDHLTAINLPNQTMDIVGNITGNLSGSVGSVTGAINTAAGTITTLDGLDTAQDTQHSQTQSDIAGLNDPTVAAIADGVWDEVLTVGTHNVGNSAGRRLRNVQDFGTYSLAAVWVDETAGGSTGTTAGEDATVTNRADDFDNAQTVADAIDLQNIQVTNGNSITLTAGLEGYNVWGNASTLALGTQNIGGTVFRQFASVSGVGTTTASSIFFEDCIFGNTTLAPAVIQQCGLGGTLTIGSAGDFILIDCYSTVAGASSPVIDMGAAVGATNLDVRRWSGGLTISNLATGDVVSVEVPAGGTITLNGADATVEVRGICDVVNNLTGSPTVDTTAVVNQTVINTQCDTALSDYDPPTNAEMEARTIAAASYATAASVATVDSNVDTMVLGIITGAAATGTLSTTQATSDLTGYADDQLIGRILTVTSGNADGEQTDITDYASASGLLTFTALTTAMANNDTFKIT